MKIFMLVVIVAVVIISGCNKPIHKSAAFPPEYLRFEQEENNE